MQITLPDELAQQLQTRVVSSNEFGSVEEYVNYILNAVLRQTTVPTTTDVASAPTSTTPSTPDPAYSVEQEKAVQQRLHDLGYLD